MAEPIPRPDEAMTPADRSRDPAAAWSLAIGRSPLAMIIVGGPEHVVHAANYAFGNLLGVPGERLTGRRLTAVLPPETVPAIDSIVTQVRDTARPKHGTEIELANGRDSPHFWRLAAWPILGSEDRPESVCVQATDVTADVAARRRERELAEEVREANDRLLQVGIREQELADAARLHAERLDSLLHSLTEGVAILDRRAGVAMMNSVGREILGIESREDRVPIEAYRRIELRRPDQTPVPTGEWPFDRALYGERFAHEELVVVRTDGTRVRVVFNGSGIGGEADGHPMGIVVFRDVTELRRLEELRAQYTSLVSHDLRAPLSSIMGYADLLEPELGRQGLERGATFAGRIRNAAGRMRDMLDDLSRSTPAEFGGLELRRGPIDLRELVDRAIEDAATPEDRDRMRAETPSPLPRVSVDPERFAHAVTNLLTNALKYSPAETPVLIRLERRGDEIWISVTDRGPGIPEDDLPQLFERFYRGRDTQAGQGLGLGLYIARLVVEAHGGRIWAESRVGEGSTFRIALPIDAESAAG